MPVPVAKAKQARFKGLNVPAASTQVGAAALGPPPKGIPAPTNPVPPPAMPVYGAAPPTAQGQAMRSDADKAMAGANTDFRDSVYRAVMALGDPTQIAKYQQDPTFAGYQFSVDPTSTISQLNEAQKVNLQNVDNAAVSGNTFFSGLRLNNQDDVRQSTNYQLELIQELIQQTSMLLTQSIQLLLLSLTIQPHP
jgi:hypothetical protein